MASRERNPMNAKKQEKEADLEKKPEEKESTTATPTKTRKGKKTISPSGFLIPGFYRRRFFYRHNPVFRGTLLITVASVLAAGIGIYQYYKATEVRKIAIRTEAKLNEEAQRLQIQKIALKPVATKYKELESLQKQLRVPLAPLLDVIEKTISNQISVTRISAGCQPVATGDGSVRRLRAEITVFFPEGVSPVDTALTEWPNKIGKELEKWGLKLNKSDWSAQRPYTPPEGSSLLLGQVTGNTRDMILEIQLLGEK